MSQQPLTVVGFEPYGGRGVNPAGQVARALDGRSLAGRAVVGRTLPVSFAALPDRLAKLFDELEPAAVLGIGLWPGEPMIRLERFGVNLADFEIADNDGLVLTDQPLSANGATALAATIPLRAIQQALLAAAIPARLSATAGTFLCNVTLYTLLSLALERSGDVACGFVHLPYLPEQVAQLLRDLRAARRLEEHQRADLASMELATMVRALQIVLEVTCAELADGGGR